jgi:polyisoprenoid-binding protein YceI
MLTKLRPHQFLVVLLFAFTCAATAETRTFELDPAQTTVSFTLGDVLHTVHGNFHLKRGTIQFDDQTGQAGGELAVDALSGDSGNKSRDKKMHKEDLESYKYSEIVFTPQRIKGSVADRGSSQVEVDGTLALHGQSHPITLTIRVQLQHGAGAADTTFMVPYEKWGVKNPSTFLLRVSDKVEISVHAVGKLNTVRAGR